MKKKMLVLPMKKKWFDLILAGEKKQEFREYKPYWTSRVNKWETANGEESIAGGRVYRREVVFKNLHPILFVNGYGANVPRFIGWSNGYSMRVKGNHKEWGEEAYDGILHFAFHILRVERENQ